MIHRDMVRETAECRGITYRKWPTCSLSSAHANSRKESRKWRSSMPWFLPLLCLSLVTALRQAWQQGLVLNRWFTCGPAISFMGWRSSSRAALPPHWEPDWEKRGQWEKRGGGRSYRIGPVKLPKAPPPSHRSSSPEKGSQNIHTRTMGSLPVMSWDPHFLISSFPLVRVMPAGC